MPSLSPKILLLLLLAGVATVCGLVIAGIIR